MSTDTVTMPVPNPGYRLGDVIRSEWTKVTSVRSSRWTMVAFAVFTVALGAVASAQASSDWATKSLADRANFDAANVALSGLAFGELAIGVLGVLVTAGEYSTGSIRSTLAAVPRRPLVLAAKAIVLGGLALVIGEIVTFATFLVGQSALGPAPAASLSNGGILREVALSGAFLALIGLFGVGLGAIIRHSAAAISTLVFVVLLAPLVLLPLPGNAQRFAPETILGSSFETVGREPHIFSPWVGFAMMVLYAAVALAVGGIVLVRRDA